MNKLTDLFEKWRYKYSLRLNIDYRNVTDWTVKIAQGKFSEEKELFSEQDTDLDVVVAKAYIFLTDWLLENNKGY